MAYTPGIADTLMAGGMAPAEAQAIAALLLTGPISGITYSSGVVQSVTGSGWSITPTYDGQGRVSTVNEAGVIRTVTYNSDGTVASYQ